MAAERCFYVLSYNCTKKWFLLIHGQNNAICGYFWCVIVGSNFIAVHLSIKNLTWRTGGVFGWKMAPNDTLHIRYIFLMNFELAWFWTVFVFFDFSCFLGELLAVNIRNVFSRFGYQPKNHFLKNACWLWKEMENVLRMRSVSSKTELAEISM